MVIVNSQASGTTFVKDQMQFRVGSQKIKQTIRFTSVWEQSDLQ